MLDRLIKFLQYIVGQVNDGGVTLETDNMVLWNVLVESIHYICSALYNTVCFVLS